MGQWQLLGITSNIRENLDAFGHILSVRFRLKYNTSLFGRFTECPPIEWKETITMIVKNEDGERQYWQHTCDQYYRNPLSQTFRSWRERYVNAYWNATGAPNAGPEFCRFSESNGRGFNDQNRPSSLKERKKDVGDKADDVRDYLKSNGGILEVLVEDKPGIRLPKPVVNVYKERWVTFDCGLKGGGQRVFAYQHLLVDTSIDRGKWKRDFSFTSAASPRFSPRQINKVETPDQYSIKKGWQGMRGEYQ